MSKRQGVMLASFEAYTTFAIDAWCRFFRKKKRLGELEQSKPPRVPSE